MQAAARAFADKGFHATTTRDIASGAGLSPAGVYVHFGSKEELLFNLSRIGHESALREVREAVSDAATPTQQLADLVATFSQWHAEQYEVLALRKQIDGVVRGILEAGTREGLFTIDDIGDTSLALLSIAVDVARWYSPTIRRTPAQIGATNAHLALRLVGASP